MINIINKLATEQNFDNVTFLLELASQDHKLYFNSSASNFIYNDVIYKPGLDIEFLQDSNSNTNQVNNINVITTRDEIESISSSCASHTTATLSIAVMKDNQTYFSNIIFGYLMKIEPKSDVIISLTIQSHALMLKRQIGDFFSPICRAEFGDEKCRKDLLPYTTISKITGIADTNRFICDVDVSDSVFTNGYIKFISSQGLQFRTKIVSQIQKTFIVLSNPNFTVELDQTVELTLPCNKTVADCKKFNNIINFRGEPFIKS